IGGMATLIGDPPNIMIGSAAGLSFNEFLFNMGPIAFLDLILMIFVVYLAYRKVLKVSKEKKERILRTLDNLDERAAIRDLALFKKSIITIVVVVLFFFVHDRLRIEPAVVALFGASLILFWSRENPEGILEKIEWATLFFFGGLFLIVGSLVETGFIRQMAQWITSHVHAEGEAILVIAWLSALASAVIDNIPFTATMIPLIKAMGMSLNTYPLWWALSLGACLGGNGTAIGASANVVVIGIAEREGIKITFIDFLKIGIIVMILTVGAGVGILWARYVW
ncbi:transporter, partial [Thermococci archaeon]